MDIPTPPASSIAPSTHPNPLPEPRKHALKPGCPKESNLINYLDRTLDNIRYKIRHKTWDKHTHGPHSPKRRRLSKDDTHTTHTSEDAKQGYKTFVPLSHDLEQIIDVVWVSSSPNLQIPYLLTVTSIIIDSLPLFGPTPSPSPAYTATLALLEKLDFAFSALLVGKDPDTGVVLPGFETGRKVSATERVRIKSAIERARMVALGVLGDEEDNEIDGGRVVGEMEDSGDEGDDEGDDVEQIDGMGRSKEGDDGMLKFEGFDNDDEDELGDSGGGDDADQRRKALGRVFERTLGELGDMLGGLEPIGIDTGN